MTATAAVLEHVHADGEVVTRGVAPDRAERGMILVHGRGATPQSILTLAGELPSDVGFTFVAPGASASSTHPRSWYPHSFLAPAEENEPGLSSALAKIGEAVAALGQHGIAPENVVLLGFSQGACLVAEYAVRTPRRWGAVVVLTGGLIGARGATRDDRGDLAGSPVFLGTSDRDPHVPLWRVDETEEVLRGMGATVEKRVYPGMPHTVNRDEIDWVGETMRRMAGG